MTTWPLQRRWGCQGCPPVAEWSRSSAGAFGRVAPTSPGRTAPAPLREGLGRSTPCSCPCACTRRSGLPHDEPLLETTVRTSWNGRPPETQLAPRETTRRHRHGKLAGSVLVATATYRLSVRTPTPTRPVVACKASVSTTYRAATCLACPGSTRPRLYLEMKPMQVMGSYQAKQSAILRIYFQLKMLQFLRSLLYEQREHRRRPICGR